VTNEVATTGSPGINNAEKQSHSEQQEQESCQAPALVVIFVVFMT
jgi:hypothetical protein